VSEKEVPSSDSRSLHRKALVLVWAGLLWNPVEALVALPVGALASSPVLIAFGIKSIIELFAGSVMVWRLRKEWGTPEEAEAAERKAERLIGITFFLLAAYITVHTVTSLSGMLPEPEASPVGIAIILASAVVMSILYVGKMRVAVPLQSRALRGEAIESLMCDLQDLAIIVGLGANALFGWWWADPVAALALIPFLTKEGREAFSEREHDEHHPGYAQVCFCSRCLFGFRSCRAVCCQPMGRA
jgi:divalent metal cation (Fe/Co/Zn/Cd) transporter